MRFPQTPVKYKETTWIHLYPRKEASHYKLWSVLCIDTPKQMYMQDEMQKKNSAWIS